MLPPVVLVHGWGGSFATTWEATGFAELLREAGRDVLGVDLLGHGQAPKPHDPAAYADLTPQIAEALPADGPVDAVGFSLGAVTLLHLACRRPDRLSRLVVAGIGDNVFRVDVEQRARMLAGVEGTAPADDVLARALGHHARQPDNDLRALAAVLRRPVPDPLTPERLGQVTCPVLVVLGDHDFSGPAEALIDALPDARLVTLRNTDHFATPESLGFFDAALGFLDARPA